MRRQSPDVTCFFTVPGVYSGVFPGRPGEGKCRSDIDFTVYFYFLFLPSEQ